MSKKEKTKHVHIVATCEKIIKSFNPVTHSVDTHCLEVLGDVTKPDATPENILMQQIVYGCFKEKLLLKKFIEDFYGDNSSRVLRADLTMYTILGYIAIFRIDEMGFAKFREVTLDIEPSKINTFIEYVFNKENLWNTHRSSWMKIKDLDFIERQMIPKIEKYVDQMNRYRAELDQNARDNAAAEAAKQEAKAKGEAGLAKVTKRPLTRPISPKITRSMPPILPEPERIVAEIKAKDVPDFIERVNLEKIANKRQQEREAAKQQTLAKYSALQQFKFHETKAGRPIEEVRKEIEDQRLKELQFNSSFYNPPPSFSRDKAQFRDNTSTILREDALYRKQQEKDAQILRNYEEELRDPTEYFLWQQDMRSRDETEKLKHVALRREQAKQSAEEAKLALVKQREDNAQIAAMVREQGDVIKKQMGLEREIEILTKQDIVQSVIAERETKPVEAMERVMKERVEKSQAVRSELEQRRLAKEIEDRAEEELRADRIRQLRALNTVHKPHIVVFDPTETARIGLLDEMSYMEMKERQRIERLKQEERVQLKKEEISQTKSKKQLDLERRVESIQRARELKAAANRSTREQSIAKRLKEQKDVEDARQKSSVVWEKELSERQAAKKAERDALQEEEERIKRQQQYLGVAQGQVAAMREKQMEMAKERQVRQMQEEFEELMKLDQGTRVKEKTNKTVLERREHHIQQEIDQDRADAFSFEKQSSIVKIKESVVTKKNMFNEGQAQHERTKTVLLETNPYGAKISQEIRTNAITRRTKMMESM